MSGIEPFLMSALAAAGEAATAVGSTVASAASSAGSAIGIGSSAAEFASIAGGTEAALSGAGAVSSGLTAGQAITAGSTLASAAGAGASLLAKPPKLNAPTMPTRDNARAEADQRAMALKRRGRAATLLSGAEGVTSAPTLGSPSLTGTA